MQCVNKHLDQFPHQIQVELAKKKQSAKAAVSWDQERSPQRVCVKVTTLDQPGKQWFTLWIRLMDFPAGCYLFILKEIYKGDILLGWWTFPARCLWRPVRQLFWETMWTIYTCNSTNKYSYCVTVCFSGRMWHSCIIPLELHLAAVLSIYSHFILFFYLKHTQDWIHISASICVNLSSVCEAPLK